VSLPNYLSDLRFASGTRALLGGAFQPVTEWADGHPTTTPKVDAKGVPLHRASFTLLLGDVQVAATLQVASRTDPPPLPPVLVALPASAELMVMGPRKDARGLSLTVTIPLAELTALAGSPSASAAPKAV
jgi:hypothetical protein